MIFSNKPNTLHKTVDGHDVWNSRSVAVNGVYLAKVKSNPDNLYVLTSTRGEAAPDFQGLQNVVAGYLDWDEEGGEAIIREAWEETGFNTQDAHFNFRLMKTNITHPWAVSTNPDNNRQNVSLKYGMIFEVETIDDLPKLTTKYNEVKNETVDPIWLEMGQVGDYKWAFNHDRTIFEYITFLAMNGVKVFQIN